CVDGVYQTISRSWTGTDACGNSTTITQLINVVDEEAPTFDAMPDDIANITCEDDFPAQQTLTATDNCSGGAVVTELDAIFETDVCAGYTVTYRWQATDNCGNFDIITKSFDVLPAAAPTITCAPAVTIDSVDELEDLVNITESEDNVLVETSCGLGYEITVAQTSVIDNGCGGIDYTYTYTVTDDCDRTDFCTRVFTLGLPAAELTCPEPLVLDCDADELLEQINAWLATASNSDGSPVSNDFDADQLTNCGMLTVVFTSFDECTEAPLDCESTITIVDDVAPVAPQAPEAATYACITDVPDMMSLTALDNCAGEIVSAGIQTDNGGSGCVGDALVITRTWTFNDDCNNQTVRTQTITVIDDVAPVPGFTPPAVFTISCGETEPQYEINWSDNCSAVTETATSSISPQECVDGVYQTISRSWTGTDACGNSTTITQLINVVDEEAPTFDA
ncbi:MAG: hypothetical protein LC650_03250, partial [Actinobacteria bacterium]|nr:hypothetical protein [Actinomycetota bacterium]